jgi:WD40 repeat protein
LSRQLVAQSTEFELQESQPETSLLLNLDALRRAPGPVKAEARFALLDKLNRPYHISTQLTGHTDAVNDVAFSPDGKLLASVSGDESNGDNTVRLWDVLSGDLHVDPLTGHTKGVTDVDFSPNGKLLASAGRDKTVRLWDVATGKQHGEPLKGHTGLYALDVAFSPDGELLASTGADTTVRLWDVDSGKPRGVIKS